MTDGPTELSPAAGASTPTTSHAQLHYPRLQHTGKRLRQILRPDGRKVHVAHSPEELDNQRRRLSSIAEKNEQFDVVLHGSNEHVSTIIGHGSPLGITRRHLVL